MITTITAVTNEVDNNNNGNDHDTITTTDKS